MDNFCRRCGSPLGEDGVCLNCGTAYSVEGIFDGPRFFGSTYNTADNDSAVEAADNVSDIEYAEEVSSDDGYSAVNYDYANQADRNYLYFAKSEQDNGGESVDYTDYDAYGDHSTENSGGSDDGQQYSQPAPKKVTVSLIEYLKDWLDCVVSLFKDEPFAAVDKVLGGGTHLWAMFAGLNVIFGAFCIAGMFGNGFVWLVDKVFGSYAMLIGFYKEYTFGNIFVLFLFSLLTVVLLFCAVTGCEYVLFSLSKKKPRVERLLRISAISFFPMTIACAVAYIFSFFLMRVAGMIIFAGAITSFQLLNEAAKREAGELPFWNVVLCNIAQTVAAVIIVSITLAVI